ncbi:hypothetical protein L7F22_042490 [Adiantum nelumboides]|nr:hypothetical protein [Adiantum nelumboides]
MASFDSGNNIGPPKSMSKIGLHQVVRLRQMVLQWRRRAANNIDRTLQVMSPRNRKLLRGLSSSGRSSLSSSSSCEGSSEAHHDLPPEGHLAIYVGQERRRFEIPTEHINHPLLRGLLERTEEEFGLNQHGGLAIPACEVVLFEHLLWMVENQDMIHLFEDPTELRELLDFYMHGGCAAGAGISTPTSCLQEANLAEVTPSTPSAVSSGYERHHHH